MPIAPLIVEPAARIGVTPETEEEPSTTMKAVASSDYERIPAAESATVKSAVPMSRNGARADQQKHRCDG